MSRRDAIQIGVPILIGLLASAIYFWAARILLLDYASKSAVKMMVFLLLPLFYWLLIRKANLKAVLISMVPKRSQLPKLAVLLVAGLILIVLINILLEPISQALGLGPILETIRSRNTIPRNTMLRRLFYIPTVNSFAEEFFFRFFLLGSLSQLGYKRIGFIASAAIFSIYHFGIFEKWFDPLQMIAVLLLLFIFGLLLNLKARHDHHIAGVFLIHGMINILIMTITLQLYS